MVGGEKGGTDKVGAQVLRVSRLSSELYACEERSHAAVRILVERARELHYEVHYYALVRHVLHQRELLHLSSTCENFRMLHLRIHL